MTDDINIILTRAEAAELGKLLDISVRAEGLNAARAAQHFIDKMNAADAQARAAARDVEVEERAAAIVAARRPDEERAPGSVHGDGDPQPGRSIPL